MVYPHLESAKSELKPKFWLWNFLRRKVCYDSFFLPLFAIVSIGFLCFFIRDGYPLDLMVGIIFGAKACLHFISLPLVGKDKE